jgi:hypothetical protein
MMRHAGGTAAALAAIAVVALAGCSQIAAIAPVGGDRLAEVRFAAGDVLVHEGVELLVAPVCTEAADATLTCEGTTIDGDTIEVAAPGDDLDTMTITVAGSTLYAGSIMDVLETAMEPTR